MGWENFDSEIAEAQFSQDAKRYFELCNQYGVSSTDNNLYEQGRLDSLRDSLVSAEFESPFLTIEGFSKPTSYYQGFLYLVAKKGIRPNSIEKDSSEKRNLLESYCGYSHLKGGVSIKQASKRQIGDVVFHLHKTATNVAKLAEESLKQERANILSA